MILKKFVIISLLITNILVFGQQPNFSKPYNWRAQWISLPDTGKYSNLWVCYRKQFNLDRVPKYTVCNISTDTKYWLYINGKLVIFEGGLKRGPSPKDTYFDNIDLTPYFVKGKNTVAILEWFFGKDGFSHKNSGQPGLLFQADSLPLYTDETWKVKVHPAYYTTSDPNPNYRLAESNVAYDATKDPGNWYEENFNDENWAFARKVGLPPQDPWGNLVARPIPLFKDYGLKDYPEVIKSKKILRKRKKDTLIVNLPYNAQITPYIKLNSKKAGVKIQMLTDNYFVAGNQEYSSVRAEYITKKGLQEYESFGWMNGHQVKYVIPRKVKVKEIKFRETGYNTEFVGSFKCNDPFYTKLWEKSARTLYVNMRDNYFDCPDRERAQWWGDVVHEMGESFYVFDQNASLLAKKGLYELFNWSRDDKTIYSPIPAGNWNQELPQQLLAVISPFGFRNYLINTNDYDTYKAFYPKIYFYLKLWKVDSLGKVEHRSGGWDWGDWGTNVDIELLDQTWYYLAITEAKKMAASAAMPGDFPVYDAKINAIKSRFDSNYWDGTSYHSKNITIPDDRANAMAVLSGLADTSKYKKIKEVLMKSYYASPYMEKYVLEALFKMGYFQEAMDRMKKRYQPMVDSRLSTLWELWELNQYGTYNHGWTGGPLTLISQYLVGLYPAEVGGMIYNFYPRPDILPKMDAVIPTLRGNVTFSCDKSDSLLRYVINWPDKALGNIMIPKRFIGSKIVSINNRQVIAGNQILLAPSTLPYNRGDSRNLPPTYRIADLKDRFMISVVQGNYEIVIK
ncbi:MAG: glycoside hydrolase [Bacteroidota bacterium]|nr:glycoside hydrolase [Bacteroidota bacterium]